MKQIILRVDSEIFSKNSILDAFLASFFNDFKKKAESLSFEISEFEKRKVLNSFQKVYKSYTTISRHFKEPREEICYDSWCDSEYSIPKHFEPLEELSLLSNSCNLFDQLVELKNNFLEVLYKNDTTMKIIFNYDKRYLNKYIHGIFPFEIHDLDGKVTESNFIIDKENEKCNFNF
jgi:hypothetical protein